jgi:processing peptidase subunit beta
LQGTKNRSQQQLEIQIENMGGHLNAYTSREQTVYHARVFKQDVGTAVEILADILQNPLLEPAAIERERSVILREQKEVEKTIDETLFDHLHGAAYQGTALGRTILGSSKQIKTLTREDMVEYMQKTYTAPRMILVGAGGVEHEELVGLANKYFANVPTTAAPQPEPAYFTGSEIRKREDDMDLAHFAVAVEGVGWSHPDYFPLLVLQSVIGSWDRSLGSSAILSSRLAQNLAENNLAQSFMAFNTTYTDTSLWGIYCQSAAKTRLDETTYYIMKEYIRLCTGLSEAEVQRAKNQLKSTLLFALDGTHAIAEDIGRQLLTFGRRMTPYEIVKRIDAVDGEKLKAVANEYLYDRDPVLVSIGPVNSLPDYNRQVIKERNATSLGNT